MIFSHVASHIGAGSLQEQTAVPAMPPEEEQA